MTAVGVVGVGHWGRYAARDLVSLGVDVTAVCRTQDSRRNAIEAGVKVVVGDVGELRHVDGVVICTPTGTHAAVIDAVAPLGVPIYVEKPITCDSAQARSLAERLGDRLFVMDKWRYHGGVLEIAKLARSGRLGKIVGLRTRRVDSAVQPRDVDSAWILMPHELSIAVEVFGDVLEPVAAVAALDSAGVVHMQAQMGTAPWHTAETSASAAARSREISVVCEGGVVFLVDPYADHVVVKKFGSEAEPERIEVATEMPLLLELKAFVEHLGGGPPPVSSAAEGLRAVEVIERLRALAGVPADIGRPQTS
ncbi:MAG: Gfo/Idh/MocA family oxidoreductase [Solirubrobacterales bacterium]